MVPPVTKIQDARAEVRILNIVDSGQLWPGWQKYAVVGRINKAFQQSRLLAVNFIQWRVAIICVEYGFESRKRRERLF